jgi:uncharacterized protein with PQ loop repeat
VLSLDLAAQSVSYLAAVIGCFVALPQVVRLVRTRATQGVSARSWQVAALSNASWLVYGVRAHQPAQLVSNGIGGVGGALVLWFVLSSVQRRRMLPWFGALVALTVLAGFVAPLAWLTLPLSVSGLVARVPQMRTTWRTWWHGSPSGISLVSWWLSVTAAGLWTVAGLLLHDVAIICSAGAACLTAGLVLAAEALPRPARWSPVDDVRLALAAAAEPASAHDLAA